MSSIRYVAIGPNKGKTYHTIAGINVVDGVVDIDAKLHASFGHVLKEHFGLVPASELPPVEGGRDADGDGTADVGPRGGKLEDARPAIGVPVAPKDLTASEATNGEVQSEIEKLAEPDAPATRAQDVRRPKGRGK